MKRCGNVLRITAVLEKLDPNDQELNSVKTELEELETLFENYQAGVRESTSVG